MREVFLNQIDENFSIIVMVMTLRDKRYDLFFKMYDGQNATSFKALTDLKQKYHEAISSNSLNNMHLVVNPDGRVCKNHYLIVIWLLTGLVPEVIGKKIAFAPTWDTNQKWLQERFNQSEIQEILIEKNKWTKKMTG